IADWATYFVGDDEWMFGVWVHNAYAPKAGTIPNKISGNSREADELADLQKKYPAAVVQRERYLRLENGERAVDSLTGEARRVDFAIIKKAKEIDMDKPKSTTANKAAQIAKENRIREAGGTFIRDRATRELIDISGVKTRISRRS